MTLPGQHGLLYHLPEYQLFSAKTKKKIVKMLEEPLLSHIDGTVRTMVSIATIIFKETNNSLVFLACYMYMYIMLVCFKVTFTNYFSSQSSVLIIHSVFDI